MLAISVYGIKQRRRKALDCSMASLAWLPHTRTLHAHTPAPAYTRTHTNTHRRLSAGPATRVSLTPSRVIFIYTEVI